MKALHNPQLNIWKAEVAATDNFRQIYVNGVKAVRACSMNKTGLKLTTTGFSTPDLNLQKFGNLGDMEVVAQSRPWTQQRLPIAGILGGAITIKTPCWKHLMSDSKYYPKPDYANQFAFRLENASEFLTFPGAWYLDRPAHTLYYIPRVYNQGHAFAMLYLDDGTTHWQVTGNVCRNVGKPVAWYLYKGFDNHADGNFTDDGFIYDRRTGPCSVERTTLVPKNGPWPAAAQAIMQAAGPVTL